MMPFDPILFLTLSMSTVLAAGLFGGLLFPSFVLLLGLILSGFFGLFCQKRFWQAMAFFIFFAVTSGWIYFVAPQHITPSGDAWHIASIVMLRIMAVGIVSTLFALTIDRAALCRALVYRVGLSRRYVYGTIAAIQLGPSLADDWRMARQINRLTQSGIRRWLPSPSLILNLLAGFIRRANDIAIGLEMRGVSMQPTTAWRVPQPTRRDWLIFWLGMMALMMGALLALIM
jgi:energy-coupling factor transporter transmembrane protein EcfT